MLPRQSGYSCLVAIPNRHGAADAHRPGTRSFFDLIGVSRSGQDRFTHLSPLGRERIFGGYLIAQAVLAAAATQDDRRHPHALHARFIRPGVVRTPIDIEVTRTSQGRSFSVRDVRILQGDDAVLTACVSFHAATPEHPSVRRTITSDFPLPDDAPERTPVGRFPAYEDRFETRAASHASTARTEGSDGPSATTFHPYWIRHRGPIPDDPIMHLAALSFISDVGVSGSAHPPGTPLRDRFESVTLDHGLWLHHPAKVDEWMLIEVSPQAWGSGRGFANGTIHDGAGHLLASFAQEVLFLPARTG